MSNGSLDPNGTCVRTDGLCTTAGWVTGFFGPSATYDVPVFSFTCKAVGQGLIYGQWTNSDTGNSGDIASA